MGVPLPPVSRSRDAVGSGYIPFAYGFPVSDVRSTRSEAGGAPRANRQAQSDAEDRQEGTASDEPHRQRGLRVYAKLEHEAEAASQRACLQSWLLSGESSDTGSSG
jgi:hypothetical protein